MDQDEIIRIKAKAFDVLLEAVRYCAARRGSLSIRYDDEGIFTVSIAGKKYPGNQNLADALFHAKSQHDIKPVSEILIKVEHASTIKRISQSKAAAAKRAAIRSGEFIKETWVRAQAKRQKNSK